MGEVRGLFRAHIYIPNDQGYKTFKTAAAWAFEKARMDHCGRAPLVEKGDPVEVRALVVTPLPVAQERKRIPRERSWCTSLRRGDLDNLAKGILDAATGVLWHDDSQVASLQIEKVVGSQGEPARVEVMIWALDDPLGSATTNFEQARKYIRQAGGLSEAGSREGEPCPEPPPASLPF
jgi:Holliday junction resolvase RusA-like endonuclease